MNEKSGVISIVIPVYNSKARLTECLDSIVSQSYPKLEVLIVDDCSTDGSLEIARSYERRFSWFHVFTKENEGVSAARNFGMSKATGEYLQFVDSDDTLVSDACQMLVSCMKRDESELVIGGYYDEKEQREKCYGKSGVFDRKAFMEEFPELFTGFFLHVPWNKLYRREKIRATFPEDMNKGEDLLFNLQVFSQVRTVSILNQPLYGYYNISDTSLSFRFREDAMEIEERLYQEVLNFYEKYSGGKEPYFLYRFYMDSVKNKFYALLGKSGFSRKKCCDVIRSWVEMKSVKELYQNRNIFGKKDRILLFLIKQKGVLILYLYYRMAVRKS